MSQFDFLDEKARDIIQSRILKGMIGPGSDTWGVEDKEEIISDYPLQRYFSGIVFPNKTICKTIDEKENTEAQSDAPIGSTETNEEILCFVKHILYLCKNQHCPINCVNESISHSYVSISALISSNTCSVFALSL